MHYILSLFKDEKLKVKTFAFLGLGIIFITVSQIIGIADNFPGILTCYLGVCSLFLVFIHPWKQTKNFLWLIFYSVVSFIVSVILHNLFEGIGLNIIGVVFFFLAILFAPAGILIGVSGSVFYVIKNNQRTPGIPENPDKYLS